jgi:hypothetical protein
VFSDVDFVGFLGIWNNGNKMLRRTKIIRFIRTPFLLTLQKSPETSLLVIQQNKNLLMILWKKLI